MTPLTRQLIVATFCRFVLKTGRRFVYPFAAVFSAGLGVALTAITTLIAINQFAGLLSPFFGPLSDRWGYRAMMLTGLILASLCMLAVGLSPNYAMLMVALLAVGIGISMCDPALQAYIGLHVPIAQRGRAMGLTEIAWSAGSILGVPAAGFLIHAYSWSTPFLLLGSLGLGGAAILRWVLPPDRMAAPSSRRLHFSSASRQFLSAWRQLLNGRMARVLLIYAFLVSCANDIFLVVYGMWLVDRFGLGLVALGLATTVIGIAELSGDLLTATLADRIGLRRAMIISLILTALCYALLPLWAYSLTGALVGIFLLFLAFEFNLVVAMSLATEVVSTARATMMSAFQASSGAGHMSGVAIGGMIWLAGGMAAVGVLCAVLCGLSLATIQSAMYASRIRVDSRKKLSRSTAARFSSVSCTTQMNFE